MTVETARSRQELSARAAARSVPMVDDTGRAPSRRRARRIALLYGSGAIILVGWAAYLGASLPGVHVARHWNVAWVGLDVLIVAALMWTAWRASRGDDRVVVPAVATATLLIVDAWMDVSTASRSDLVLSIALAACVELPLAAVSLRVARRPIRKSGSAACIGRMIVPGAGIRSDTRSTTRGTRCA